MPTTKETIGSRIKQRRKQLGITSATLSQNSGISSNTLWRIENNENYYPTANILSNIAKCLHTSCDYLVNGNTLPVLVTSTGTLIPDQSEKFDKIMSAYQSLSDDQKNMLYLYIQLIILNHKEYIDNCIPFLATLLDETQLDQICNFIDKLPALPTDNLP